MTWWSSKSKKAFDLRWYSELVFDLVFTPTRFDCCLMFFDELTHHPFQPRKLSRIAYVLRASGQEPHLDNTAGQKRGMVVQTCGSGGFSSALAGDFYKS